MKVCQMVLGVVGFGVIVLMAGCASHVPVPSGIGASASATSEVVGVPPVSGPTDRPTSSGTAISAAYDWARLVSRFDHTSIKDVPQSIDNFAEFGDETSAVTHEGCMAKKTGGVWRPDLAFNWCAKGMYDPATGTIWGYMGAPVSNKGATDVVIGWT